MNIPLRYLFPQLRLSCSSSHTVANKQRAVNSTACHFEDGGNSAQSTLPCEAPFREYSLGGCRKTQQVYSQYRLIRSIQSMPCYFNHSLPIAHRNLPLSISSFLGRANDSRLRLSSNSNLIETNAMLSDIMAPKGSPSTASLTGVRQSILHGHLSYSSIILMHRRSFRMNRLPFPRHQCFGQHQQKLACLFLQLIQDLIFLQN